MGLKVKHGKKESAFDRKRFTNWLKSNYEIPNAVAERISRTTHQHVASKQDLIDAKELPGIARLLIGQSLTTIWDSKRVNSILPVAASLPPIPDISGAAGSILEAIIRYFEKKGWETDEPGSMILEQPGFIPPFDDQKAPDIGEVTFSNPRCCTTGLGGKGVEIDITVSVTDTGGIGNCSGVTSIKVCGVHMDGNQFFLRPSKTKKLTDKEEEKSEDEEVNVTISLCFPCQFIINGCVNLLIKVMDDDDNGRISLTRVAIPNSLQTQCCS